METGLELATVKETIAEALCLVNKKILPKIGLDFAVKPLFFSSDDGIL